MAKNAIHPDWQKCTSIEQLIEGLANNASLLGAERGPWIQDARDCFARAFQIAAEGVLTPPKDKK